MQATTLSIEASGGGQFDCHPARPAARTPVPAIVLASAVYGVDGDLKAIADEFASLGYLAAAPVLPERPAGQRIGCTARSALIGFLLPQ
jgi:carboxymethylenebutenolidase